MESPRQSIVLSAIESFTGHQKKRRTNGRKFNVAYGVRITIWSKTPSTTPYSVMQSVSLYAYPPVVNIAIVRTSGSAVPWVCYRATALHMGILRHLGPIQSSTHLPMIIYMSFVLQKLVVYHW